MQVLGSVGRVQLPCLCVHSIPRIAHFRLNFPGSCCAPRWLMSEIKFEASGLAQDWDYVEVLRERMRTGHARFACGHAA